MNLDKCNWLNGAFNKINFNNLPHGIIINGPAGIGKKILAKAISEKIINNFAVDNNETITNLINKNNHPDLYMLDKDKILLKDIRRQKKDSSTWDDEKGFNDVVSFLTLTPSISKNKVVCMLNADTMNVYAQNALLKSLEEPAPHSYVIMTTSRSKSLNQTIYSRCRVINLPIISASDIDAWLSANGLSDYSSYDFPSYSTPFSILENIQSEKENSYKEFIGLITDFLSEKTDQSQAIKSFGDLEVSFIEKINFVIEFLKIILKSKVTGESLSGKYNFFNRSTFSNLKISNIISDLNNLRNDFYEVSSINETHVLNYYFSELKQSIKQ